MLPLVVGNVINGRASLARIQEFLDAEDIHDSTVWQYSSHYAVQVRNAQFAWERGVSSQVKDVSNAGTQHKIDKDGKHSDMKRITSVQDTSIEGVDYGRDCPFQLNNINLTANRGDLIVVIGSVGVGKSSLLAALAGEMTMFQGSVVMGVRQRAVCSQYAWIQNTTVRENIVFGRSFDQQWYDQVVDACALREDFNMLLDHDLTEIGERGINLSGGQKQRINIARAIYSRAELVLLDDPLSAVDAQVGKHILDHAICGLLSNNTRIMATHQLHILPRADQIIWMKDGTIYTASSFQDLLQNDPEFRNLLNDISVQAQGATKQNGDRAPEPEARIMDGPRTQLMQQEDQAVSSIGKDVWLAYFRASGSILIVPAVLLLLAAFQATTVFTSIWLAHWVEVKWDLSTATYIGVYAALAAAQGVFVFVFAVMITFYATKASKTILAQALHRVMHAPISFFDTTPVGRIMNRLSKDIDILDNVLPESIRMFLLTMGVVLGIYCLVIVYYAWFLLILAFLSTLFFIAAAYYRRTAREVKRHEAVLRSTVFARFGESVTGTSAIRAYAVQDQFRQRLENAVDSMDGAYFLTFAVQKWLSVRLDALGILSMLGVCLLVATHRFWISPSTSGLVLSYIVSLPQMVPWIVVQFAEVENNMNAVERIHHYQTKIEEEGPERIGIRPSWPEHGEIHFENVQMRYRPGLPLVLRGFTAHVRPGERVGIIGRTGAGKSSIFAALFRLMKYDGSITIDGIDTKTVGLQELRSNLAIIPQDPTLFRGTIRSNLDPYNKHSDLQLWNALRQAGLSADSTRTSIQLDTFVDDEGLNFSLGQRQLLALARALVREARIILCDEATSSVDFEMDQKIALTIAGLRNVTLLCIAHRLRTIIGYDRIIVMDQGVVSAIGTAIALFDGGGIFRIMCDKSNISREDLELALAR